MKFMTRISKRCINCNRPFQVPVEQVNWHQCCDRCANIKGVLLDGEQRFESRISHIKRVKLDMLKRATVVLLVALVASCVDVERVDHTAPWTPGSMQQEGCHEVESETQTIMPAAACAAQDGTACTFAVELADGTTGCCTTVYVDPVGLHNVENWHTCEVAP